MNLFFSIIGILFILIFLFYLDLLLGRKKHFAEKVCDDYPVRNSHFEIFTKGPDLFTDLFDEIKRAGNHVHIEFYIAKTDSISSQFFSILKEKAREGVEVRLLLDRIGSKSISKAVVSDLKAAGIHFSFSHVPKFPYFFYSLNVRNHRKITVIDGKIGYIGGFNVGKEYINLDEKLSPWRDYHLKLTGKAVHDLQNEFMKDWQRATSESITRSDYYPESEEPSGSATIQVVSSEGFSVESAFSERIRSAEKSILIGSPYFIPSRRLFSDLIDALNREVKLTILVPQVSDHALVQEASYRFLRKLLKAGAEVYQFTGGFYHAKVLLFDEVICDIGTTNFDQRSFFLNYEINCFIYDQHTISTVKKVLNQDLAQSQKLSLPALYHVSVWTRLKEGIAYLFSWSL